MKKFLFLFIPIVVTGIILREWPRLRSLGAAILNGGAINVSDTSQPAHDSQLSDFTPPESPLPMLSVQPVVKKYAHTNPVFSFNYPQALTLKTFGDENSETVLAHGQDNRREFQIYITPQDEDFVVTKERIAQDIPDLVIEQPAPISIGGIQGLSFLNRDSSGLVTREVWFVHDKFLYQITSYPDYTEQLGAILGTWRF